MSMSYTANIRCMSPLDAEPVPLVGSKPFPSAGSRTVSAPPGLGGSITVPGAVVVVCSWLTGLASVVLVVALALLVDVVLVDGFVVVVDPFVPTTAVVLVVLSSTGGAVVDVSSGMAGSGLTSGSVTVL